MIGVKWSIFLQLIFFIKLNLRIRILYMKSMFSMFLLSFVQNCITWWWCGWVFSVMWDIQNPMTIFRYVSQLGSHRLTSLHYIFSTFLTDAIFRWTYYATVFWCWFLKRRLWETEPNTLGIWYIQYIWVNKKHNGKQWIKRKN